MGKYSFIITEINNAGSGYGTRIINKITHCINQNRLMQCVSYCQKYSDS